MGAFYDRTLLGTVDNFLTDYKYSRSFTANFPAAPDLGPRNGRFPTEPMLQVTQLSQITPAQRAILNALYPPGSTVRNTGTVTWDDPNRQQPYFHQVSVGYEREVLPGVSASVDYVRMNGRDMFFNPNLNVALGLNDTRDGPRQEPGPDPFGVLRSSLAPGGALRGTRRSASSQPHGHRLRCAEHLGRNVLRTSQRLGRLLGGGSRGITADKTRRSCRFESAPG
jgi:hypothetical protein